jgi:hypothetical protein
VIVHPDHDERRVRSSDRQRREPLRPRGAEHGLVDNRHRRRRALQQADQIGGVGGRRERLDVRLALEQAPQRLPDAVVASRDEDGDRCVADREGTH